MKNQKTALDSIAEAIEEIKQGKMIIIVDDEDRENEGDLVIAADFATPEAINFMATHGRGLICLAMEGSLIDRFQLPLMVQSEQNGSGFGTNFTLSVEANEGVTTGISAHDRAHTIQVLVDPESKPGDIVSPGHMFPLRARDGGVLVRRGQTEASVDMSRLAGLAPAGVICEVMSADGTMARLPELLEFAAEHNIMVISVEDLVAFRLEHDLPFKIEDPMPIVNRVDEAQLPTEHGLFRVTAYRDAAGREHLALRMGNSTETPLVRIHSECVTGDLLGSLRCDCGAQLQAALRRIGELGEGVLVYLRQEGRGIGLANKIRAYALQDQGHDTVEANEALGFAADGRDFGLAAAILVDQGIDRVALMTNNPEKVKGLERFGIQVNNRVAHQFGVTHENFNYLKTKAEKMAHQLVLGQ